MLCPWILSDISYGEDGSVVVLPMRLRPFLEEVRLSVRRGDPNGDSSRAWFSIHLGAVQSKWSSFS